MSELKTGDRVKVSKDVFTYPGEEGVIVSLNVYSDKYKCSFDCLIDLGHIKEPYDEEQLTLVKLKAGCPVKAKKIKFIAQYDLVDGNPVKEFYSRPELMKWLEEAKKNEEIVWESIKIYPVDKVWKPKANIKISLRNIIK